MAAFAQEEYARHLLERFLAEAGVRAIRTYAAPGVSQADADEQVAGREQEEGQYARTARSHLGGLLYLARASRPDLLEAVASLAREVSRWGPGADKRLVRVFGYLQGSLGHILVQEWAKEEDPNEAVLAAYADADHAGDVATGRSTSGWITYLQGRIAGCMGTSRSVLDFGSRRQSVVARSTAEAECVAHSDLVTRSALPQLALLEAILGRTLPLRGYIDAEAARMMIRTGASQALRYMVKHQRVNIQFLKDIYDEEQHGDARTLARVESTANDSDFLTKPLQRTLFEKGIFSIGIRNSADMARYIVVVRGLAWSQTPEGGAAAYSTDQRSADSQALAAQFARTIAGWAGREVQELWADRSFKRAFLAWLRGKGKRAVVAAATVGLLSTAATSSSSGSGSGGVLPSPEGNATA